VKSEVKLEACVGVFLLVKLTCGY